MRRARWLGPRCSRCGAVGPSWNEEKSPAPPHQGSRRVGASQRQAGPRRRSMLEGPRLSGGIAPLGGPLPDVDPKPSLARGPTRLAPQRLESEGPWAIQRRRNSEGPHANPLSCWRRSGRAMVRSPALITRGSYCTVGVWVPGHSACTSRPGVGMMHVQHNPKSFYESDRQGRASAPLSAGGSWRSALKVGKARPLGAANVGVVQSCDAS